MQGEQGAFRPPFDFTIGQPGLQFGEVGVFAGRVDHDVEIIGAAGEHEVVINAALGVHQEGIALLVDFQPVQVNRQQAFQAARNIRAADKKLPHMRHVEEPGVLACPQVFFYDAFSVLHRHRVAGEGDDFRAVGDVPVVEGGAFLSAHIESP